MIAMTMKISMRGVTSMLRGGAGNGGGGPMMMKVELEVMVVPGKMVVGTVAEGVGTMAPAPEPTKVFVLLNICYCENEVWWGKEDNSGKCFLLTKFGFVFFFFLNFFLVRRRIVKNIYLLM